MTESGFLTSILSAWSPGFPPGLVLMLAGLLLPLSKGLARKLIVLGAPILTLITVWAVGTDSNLSLRFLDYTLSPVDGSGYGLVFATIFSIMAFVGGLYALNQARVVELAAGFV